MRCPLCASLENKVVDSRLSKDGRVIRRRRSCSDCDRRFTTYERYEEFLPLVVKKDGTREAFDRQKIIQGMSRACEKRRVSAGTIEEVVNDLERILQEEGGREVSTAWLGEWVMRQLRSIDEVAYVRFASVYRSFRDINEFMDELKDLLDAKARVRTDAEKSESGEGEGTSDTTSGGESSPNEEDDA
ncbi:MAG: transcriptional regulator NrdR [bacterium]